MSEDFRSAIGDSVGDGNNEASSTPETAAPQTEATPQSGGVETPEKTGEADFLTDTAFDWTKLNPDVVPLAKQLQADYTRKTQTLAEQRKALEGIDEGAIAWVKSFQQAAQTNPQLAAQMLEQERQRFSEFTPPPDPMQQTQWLSDGERVLAERFAQQDRVIKELQQDRERAQIDQRFSALEKEIGREVKHEDRVKVAQFCVQHGIGDPAIGWKAMNFSVGVQMGRDQAASVVAQKAGMGAAPSGVASRTPAETERVPKTAREALEMAYEEAERRSG